MCTQHLDFVGADLVLLHCARRSGEVGSATARRSGSVERLASCCGDVSMMPIAFPKLTVTF